MVENQLMHYGILGMKWGVRRTPEQLARARGKTASKKEPNDSDKDRKEKSSREKDLKNRRTLSTSDIQKKIDRLRLEKQFKSLTEEDLAPGKKLVSDILGSAGKKVLEAAAAGAMAYTVKALMTKKFDAKEAASYIAPNPNKK